MLSRPVVGCPSLQRQIRASGNAIWVTEEAISQALYCSCSVPKPARRSASSVPGPMESRRRLGKRRMANLSEASQTSIQDVGALWGISAAAGRNQWHWEPPSKPRSPFAGPGTTRLPMWLSESETIPEVAQPLSLDSLNTPPPNFALPFTIEAEMVRFSKELMVSSKDQMQPFYEFINHRMKQNLMLGLIPGNKLSAYLQRVTKIMEEVTACETLAMSCRQFFYLATWEGIKASRVLGPDELEATALNSLLNLIGEIPSKPLMQKLVIDIIHSASREQTIEMTQGILSVVQAWLSSWTDLVAADGKDREKSKNVDKHLATTRVDELLKVSVATLAAALGRLPAGLTRTILYASTEHLVTRCLRSFSGQSRGLRALRYSWVSVIANMPSVDEDLLVQIWSIMNFSDKREGWNGVYTPSIPGLTLHESCNLLLDFWISHGYIKEPKDVRSAFRAFTKTSSRADHIGYLLQAIDEHHEMCWTKIQSLFRFMRLLKKPHAVYHILRVLRDRNMRVPASLLAVEIREMSRLDPRCALNMSKLYPAIRYDNKPLLLDGCPELVVGMIRCSDFHPAEIWGALGVPRYDPRRVSLSSKPLSRSRINLVHKMALAFAQADCRPPRVALRNVMQCVMYLRRHRVPVAPELTRALAYTGITRDLLRQHWVGTEKVLWILELVKQVEGSGVAARMGRAVFQWRHQYVETQEQTKRRANPLRVGPIR